MDITKITKNPLYYVLYSVSLIVSILILMATLYLLKPINIKDEQYLFEIQKGETLYNISTKLANDGLIPSPFILRKIMYYTGLDYNIRAGEYQITPGMRTFDLIKMITTGNVKRYDLQIIEGSTLTDLFAKFKESTVIKKTVNYDREQKLIDEDLVKSLRELIKKDHLHLVVNLDELNTLEGLLFPDKYFYSKGETDLNLLKRALVKLNKTLDKEWENREFKESSVVKTPYQVLTLASILEKESSDPDDRKLVAGVVYNRLKANMPLQVDPTVIYALGNKYTGNLTKEDLKFKSKYNTYVAYGLPPGPIGFVSLNAIHAALNPTIHNMIYFVSMGNGKHFFSATLDEHNAAVQKYQKSSIIKTPNLTNEPQSNKVSESVPRTLTNFDEKTSIFKSTNNNISDIHKNNKK